MFDLLPNCENGRFGRFGRPAEPSFPKGRRFGRLWRDSRFHLRNFENEANLHQTSNHGFSNWKPRFVRMTLKRTVLKNSVFDWELCLHLCKVYRFQNLVGLELPIKDTPNNLQTK